MGHADIKTTMVYTHYAPGANEAELVNGVFEAPGAGASTAPTDADPRAASLAHAASAKRRGE